MLVIIILLLFMYPQEVHWENHNKWVYYIKYMVMKMIHYHYLEEENIPMIINMNIIHYWVNMGQKCKLLQRIKMMNWEQMILFLFKEELSLINVQFMKVTF